jgi:hypothetical protein
MCSAVAKRISAECKKHGIKKEPFLSSRVTQVIIIEYRYMILEQ